jgi:hypothetical protein
VVQQFLINLYNIKFHGTSSSNSQTLPKPAVTNPETGTAMLVKMLENPTTGCNPVLTAEAIYVWVA